jgi:hypothetical protein
MVHVMRRVRDVLGRARAARGAFFAVAVLVVAVAGAAATVPLLGDGNSLTTTPEPALGAARIAPKVATSVVPTTSTTSTTTSAAPPATDAVTVPPATNAPARPAARPAAPAAPAPPPAPAPTAAPAPAPPPPPPASGQRCLVRLHGKGGSGGGTYRSGDVTVIEPTGNAPGWGGRQWLYFAPASYASAASGVIAAVDAAGCGQVIVNGFSNGGAMAMKLYCRGETFGGRLVGVVVDDPVPDHGADGCARPGGVALTVYWTGALDHPAQPGWNCAEGDWTCEGGTTVGIGTYAANAGVAAKASPHGSHTWYENAPEIRAWR